MQNRYKRLFFDTGLFALSNLGSKILTFLLVPLYTSILSTEEYGTADILTTTANLLYPILTLSIYEATLRFALDKKYKKENIASTSILLTVFASLSLLLITPLCINTDTIFGRYWGYFLGIFILVSFQTFISNYIKGCGYTKIFALQGIVYTIIFLLLNILFLLYYRIGLQGYMLSAILSSFISCLYMLFSSGCYRDFIPLKFNRTVTKEMLKYSCPLILSSVAWWINASADKYMILGLISVSANGLYGVAHKIPTVFTTFTSIFSQAWRISAISTFDENDKQIYYSKVYQKYSLTCIYVCMILVLSSQFLAGLLFKSDYYQAWILIPPLVVATLFEAYAGFLASIYAAARKTKFLSISTCVGSVINIILNYILIRFLGILGAPIATMVSFLIVWIMRLKVLKSFMPIEIDLSKILLSVFIVIASGLYFSFRGTYKYIVELISIIVVVVINFRETKNLFNFIVHLFKSIKWDKEQGGSN